MIQWFLENTTTLNTNFWTLSVCERKNRFEVALARAMATYNETEICDEIIYCDLLFILDKFSLHTVEY